LILITNNEIIDYIYELQKKQIKKHLNIIDEFLEKKSTFPEKYEKQSVRILVEKFTLHI
jgi:hypothetical protein